MFLGLSEKDVGQVGAGKRRPNGRLDVAMIQSLVRKGRVDDLVASYYASIIALMQKGDRGLDGELNGKFIAARNRSDTAATHVQSRCDWSSATHRSQQVRSND